MKEKTLYQGQYIQVKEQKINETIWEKVYLRGGISVYPFFDPETILLVKEFRPHEKPSLRLKPVTGIFEEEYDVFQNANREMQEEIGFKAKEMEIILHTKSSGTVNNFQYFIKAWDLEISKIPNPDGEDTIQEIIHYPYQKLIKELSNGDIAYRNSFLGIYHMALKEKINQ